jgi:[histone H3]-lysine36 N-dimethyltransferase SETMAR
MEKSKQHIRHCLLFQYQCQASAAEATRIICSVIAPDAVSIKTAEMWFKRFRNGDYSLEDKPKSGRPSTINLDSLKELIESDPSLTTRQLATTLRCSKNTISYHFSKLELVSKLGALIPYDLNQLQLNSRVEAGQRLLDLHRSQAWLKQIITCDEKWVCYNNITRKRQWVKRTEHAKPTPKPPLHQKKRMLSVWWGTRGVVYWELVPPNKTIDNIVYCAQIERLTEKLRTIYPNWGKVYYQHDNARPHVHKDVQNKIKSLNWEILEHPAYSPDLAPSDYYLFLSLSNDLRNRQFKEERDLKEYLSSFFRSKSPEFYERGINDLPRRWRMVIDSHGEYVPQK